jgi:peptide chain release factor 1
MKSQHRNKERAMMVVLSRLHDKDQNKAQAGANDRRKGQIQNMGRGDKKVRTYSFTEGIVRDERTRKTFRVNKIMSGKLDLIYKEVK